MQYSSSAVGAEGYPWRSLLRWFAAGLVMISLFYWAAVFLLSSPPPQQRAWHAFVQFDFPGAELGVYPNGTPFSHSDLTSPVILRAVVEELNLTISPEELGQRLSISAFAPARDDIVRRYHAALGRDLSRAELAELEKEFQADLNRTARGQARISLTTANRELPIADILEAIPRVWANYVVSEQGAFSLPLRMQSAEVVRGSIVGDLDYLLAYDRLREMFGLLRSNVALLREQSNSGRVRSANGGLTVADISARAAELEDFVLEEAIVPTLALGISSRPEATIRFFEDRIRSLERRQQLDQQQARHVDEVLADYADGPSPRLGAGQGDSGALAGQFGSDFLNRLVQLGADGGEMDFRQNLSRRSLDLELSAAARDSEITRLRRLIERIEVAQSGNSDLVDPELLKRSEEQAMLRIQQVMSALETLFLASEDIAVQLGRLRFPGEDKPYSFRMSAEPDSSPRWLGPRQVLTYQLGLSAFSLLVVILGLLLFVRQRLSGNRKSKQ